jgi:hypothetical protein
MRAGIVAEGGPPITLEGSGDQAAGADIPTAPPVDGMPSDNEEKINNAATKKMVTLT